jgi:hypothetical protein
MKKNENCTTEEIGKVAGKLKDLIFILLLLSIWLFPGCFGERPTHVEVKGGTMPVFILAGSGELSNFSIYLLPPSPETMDKPIFDETPVWRIEALPNWLHGRPVEEISQLTYGVVPPRYKQTISKDGSPPPAIIPGRAYFFDCETTDAPIARGAFQVNAGKAVPVVVRMPCLEVREGKWVTVPCPRYP